MKENFKNIFESILDNISKDDNKYDSAASIARGDISVKHEPYPYATFRDYEHAAWNAGFPLVVCIELMLFRENEKFVKYFDLIDEIVQQQKFPHLNVVAAHSDGKEMQLVHPDSNERIASACYYIAIRPTLRQFLDFMTIISGLTIRANSKDSLTPSVEVYQKWNGRDAKNNPYKCTTTHSSWQSILGTLYNKKLRMMPFKCSKKKYKENISEICELLM